MIFIGNNEDTVETLKVGLKHCSVASGYYPDGTILWFNRPPEGDGTVLASSAELGSNVSYGGERQEGHAKLVKAFAGDVALYINGGAGEVSSKIVKALARLEAPTITKSLSIATKGSVRPLLTSPTGQKVGIENGQSVNQIPDGAVDIDIDSGGINIENPSDGTYAIALVNTTAEDYAITISYSDSSVASDFFSARGFNSGNTIAFTFTLDSASTGNILTINHAPQRPTGLQADAINSGGLKTRLTWDLSTDPNVTGYNIYSKYNDEPCLSELGSSTSNSFDTGHAWAENSSIKTRIYAVSAVKSDSKESFLSDMVQNNDRDHDSLTDEEEASYGTNINNPDTDGDGLKDGEEYVRGTNPLVVDTDGDGYSDYAEIQAGSDPIDVNSIPPCTTPATPSLISPSDGAPNVSTAPALDWGDVSGANSYDAQVCSDDSCSSVARSANLIGSQWTVSPVLNQGTQYWWRVRANNSCGNSSWTGTWSFTTTSTSKVTLLSPNGGDVIASGSVYLIEWEAPAEVVKFKLTYSLDNGLTWIPIPKTADFITGTSYDWTVPKQWGNKKACLIKVIGYDVHNAKVGADKSDESFTIEVLRLTSPNGNPGDLPLISGDSHPITWTTNATKRDVARVKLYYTKNGGVTWDAIYTIKGSNPGSYNWTVPTVKKDKTQCKVRVELKDALGNTLGKDNSDSYFTIQPRL